jgi:hypothetical protein
MGRRAHPDQFDLFGATQARDAALKRVRKNSGPWFDAAMELVIALAPGWTGIAEDLRRYITRHIGLPHHPGTWGALTRQAIRRKLLIRTGERGPMKDRRSHARQSDIYVRVAQ